MLWLYSEQQSCCCYLYLLRTLPCLLIPAGCIRDNWFTPLNPVVQCIVENWSSGSSPSKSQQHGHFKSGLRVVTSHLWRLLLHLINRAFRTRKGNRPKWQRVRRGSLPFCLCKVSSLLHAAFRASCKTVQPGHTADADTTWTEQLSSSWPWGNPPGLQTGKYMLCAYCYPYLI